MLGVNCDARCAADEHRSTRIGRKFYRGERNCRLEISDFKPKVLPQIRLRNATARQVNADGCRFLQDKTEGAEKTKAFTLISKRVIQQSCDDVVVNCDGDSTKMPRLRRFEMASGSP
jgi:hypothetical protein